MVNYDQPGIRHIIFWSYLVAARKGPATTPRTSSTPASRGRRGAARCFIKKTSATKVQLFHIGLLIKRCFFFNIWAPKKHINVYYMLICSSTNSYLCLCVCFFYGSLFTSSKVAYSLPWFTRTEVRQREREQVQRRSIAPLAVGAWKDEVVFNKP